MSVKFLTHKDSEFSDESESEISERESTCNEMFPDLDDDADEEDSGVLMDYLKGIQQRIQSRGIENEIQKQIRDGHFWIYPPSPLFKMKKQSTFGVEPFYYPIVSLSSTTCFRVCMTH
jgi:hypothetical protein